MLRRKLALIIIGILLALISIASIVGGSIILYLNQGNDKEGYALSEAIPIKTSASAFLFYTSPLSSGNWSLNWLLPGNLSQAKWIVNNNSSKELFVGWAKVSDIENYLNSNNIAFEIAQYYQRTTRPYYSEVDIYTTATYGTNNAIRPPAQETFWQQSSNKAQAANINWSSWTPQTDRYSLVIMNADGSNGVNANLQLGYKIMIFDWLAYLLLPLGVLVLILGALIVRKGTN
jgi:hypothetical protein